MNVMAIDPGQSGGIAFLQYDLKQSLTLFPMPMLDKKRISVIELSEKLNVTDYVFIEKGQPGNYKGAMIKHQNHGRLYGVLELMNIDYTDVHSRTWKKILKMPDLSGMTTYQREKVNKQTAIEFAQTVTKIPLLNPKSKRSRKLHDGIADAVCILTWGMMEKYDIDIRMG